MENIISMLKCFVVLIWMYQVNAICSSTKQEESGQSVCVVSCLFGQKACECESQYDVCEYYLEISEMRTFISYATDVDYDNLMTRKVPGVIYNIDDSGAEIPRQNTPHQCLNSSIYNNCTTPLYVDGYNYRVIQTINAQVPAPTLIVVLNQTISVFVKSKLANDVTTIHWHGIHQTNTGFMDGASGITQCAILPGTSFNYRFQANPSGTFWYHTHIGTGRADAPFGALIIREPASMEKIIKTKLWDNFGIDSYMDFPDKHTMTIVDWFPVQASQNFDILASFVGHFPDIPITQVPKPSDSPYAFTFSSDLSFAGPLPYFSALINGLGRNERTNLVNTRLSVFTVTKGYLYRFRVIGAQGLFPFKISVDNHKLIVIGTDGTWLEPIKEVNYIILQSGERYDFLINATEKEGSNFAIRAETIEIILGSSVPFQSAGHEVQAILHYYNSNGINEISSPMYESILNNSLPWNCTQSQDCIAVNCPFENFHSSYGINCKNIGQMKQLLETPEEVLPSVTPDNCTECTQFLNFNIGSSEGTPTINGRSMVIPTSPPVTQEKEFYDVANICPNLGTQCNSYKDCHCTHVIDIPYNKTIQFVVSNLGLIPESHSIHIHGNRFFVVYMGYPTYHPENGTIKSPTSDIACLNRNQNPADGRCTIPNWTNNAAPFPFNITNKSPQKDTLIVPPNGYAVLNIKSMNPGWWLLHCHIEVHNFEGMSLVLNVAPNNRNSKVPTGMGTCGNFKMDSEEYAEFLRFDPDNPTISNANGCYSSLLLLAIVISITLML